MATLALGYVTLWHLRVGASHQSIALMTFNWRDYTGDPSILISSATATARKAPLIHRGWTG